MRTFKVGEIIEYNHAPYYALGVASRVEPDGAALLSWVVRPNWWIQYGIHKGGNRAYIWPEVWVSLGMVDDAV